MRARFIQQGYKDSKEAGWEYQVTKTMIMSLEQNLVPDFKHGGSMPTMHTRVNINYSKDTENSATQAKWSSHEKNYIKTNARRLNSSYRVKTESSAGSLTSGRIAILTQKAQTQRSDLSQASIKENSVASKKQYSIANLLKYMPGSKSRLPISQRSLPYQRAEGSKRLNSRFVLPKDHKFKQQVKKRLIASITNPNEKKLDNMLKAINDKKVLAVVQNLKLRDQKMTYEANKCIQDMNNKVKFLNYVTGYNLSADDQKCYKLKISSGCQADNEIDDRVKIDGSQQVKKSTLANSNIRYLEKGFEEMSISNNKKYHEINSLPIPKQETSQLLRAIINGDFKTIDGCLMKDSSLINSVDCRGNTALHYAVKYDDKRLVEIFLGRGADGTIRNHGGSTALDIAIRLNHTEIKEILM